MPLNPSIRSAIGSRAGRTAAVALCAALIGGGTVAVVDSHGGGTTTIVERPTAVTPVSTASGAAQTDFSEVYAQRRKGVVSITATVEQSSDGYPGAPEQQATAGGTGVVIDDDGHVLTNEHVVSGASKVEVTLASGTAVTAKVLGTDPSTDLALLKIDVPADQLDPIPLGDSSAIQVGDPVMAIGDPFGLEASASAGIVSGLNRTMQAPNGFTITGAIQTDAAVNHGNSGGALLDAAGNLIGIPAQIADSGVDANVGVAFAIPSNTAKQIIAQLEKGGTVEHAWLGVSTATVDSDIAQIAGLGTDRGALITGVVAGGPAQKAGLDPGDSAVTTSQGQVCAGGDVVTAVGDAKVTDAADLQEAIDAQKPGADVPLTVVNASGKSRTVSVTLGTRPAQATQTTRSCAP
ncbi:MAG: S1C family serine protease [Thermoleophilia bacterium]